MRQHYSSAPTASRSSTAARTTWSKTRRSTSKDAQASQAPMCLMCRAYWTSPLCLKPRVHFRCTQLLWIRALSASLCSCWLVNNKIRGSLGISLQMINSTLARRPGKQLRGKQASCCHSIPRASKSYPRVKNHWKFTWSTHKITSRFKSWRRKLTNYFPLTTNFCNR